MIRVVFDTNIVVSSLFWRGAPNRALDAAVAGLAQLLATEPLVSELRTTLARPKFERQILASGKTLDEFIAGYTRLLEMVEPAEITGDVVRDPKDVMILACAVGGKADCIVSGDADLLVLQYYETIPIVNAVRFLEMLNLP